MANRKRQKESWLVNGYNQFYITNKNTQDGGVMIRTRDTCMLKQMVMPFDEETLAELSKNIHILCLCG